MPSGVLPFGRFPELIGAALLPKDLFDRAGSIGGNPSCQIDGPLGAPKAGKKAVAQRLLRVGVDGRRNFLAFGRKGSDALRRGFPDAAAAASSASRLEISSPAVRETSRKGTAVKPLARTSAEAAGASPLCTSSVM